MSTLDKDHAKTLTEDGVVAIRDYLNQDRCNKLYARISDLIESDEIEKVEARTYDYNELANWDGPVADVRAGRDEGMIDVFNIDEAVGGVSNFKQNTNIKNIINKAAEDSYSPDNVNAYWNRSVTNTRDFHADTYSGKFKSFLYLTDVPDLSYGPFGYVKGSHCASAVKIKLSKKLNKLRGKNSTDAVFYNNDDVVYFTAPKGTLIIANQAGYHRGHPQEEGKERMLVTTSYTPDE